MPTKNHSKKTPRVCLGLIPTEYHYRLKCVCVRRKLKMSRVLSQLITDWCDCEEARESREQKQAFLEQLKAAEAIAKADEAIAKADAELAATTAPVENSEVCDTGLGKPPQN
jgi:hypothetical protein